MEYSCMEDFRETTLRCTRVRFFFPRLCERPFPLSHERPPAHYGFPKQKCTRNQRWFLKRNTGNNSILDCFVNSSCSNAACFNICKPCHFLGAPVMSTLDNYSRLVSVAHKAIGNGEAWGNLSRKNGRWLICP